MDLTSYAQNASPEEQAKIMAMAVRGRNPLAEASQQAHSMDMGAVAASMSNNPALAQAAQMAMKNQQAQYKPVAMGHQGMVIPGTGEYSASPMFTEEQASQRASREQIAQQGQQGLLMRAMEAMQQREADRAQRGQIAANHESVLLAMKAMGMGNKSAAAELKLGADTDKRISKLTTTLDKSGIPEFESGLEIVKSVFARHGTEDIPGFGRLGSLAPDWMTSPEGLGNRQDMQQAANVLLKIRSGAAVTKPEEVRFLREIQSGRFVPAAALKRGWDNIERTFAAKRANLLAGVNADDLAEYNSRTGKSYAHGTAPKPIPADGNRPGVTGPPAAPQAAPAAPRRVDVDLNGDPIK